MRGMDEVSEGPLPPGTQPDPVEIVEMEAAVSTLIDQLQETLLACLLLEYEHEALRQLTHALNNINTDPLLVPHEVSYLPQPICKYPAMDLTQLPPELVLHVGSYLDQPSLNALVRTRKWFAELLTAQLYDSGLRLEDDIEKHLKSKESRPQGVLRPNMWPSRMGRWSSPWILDYFMTKHHYRYAVPSIKNSTQDIDVIPLAHAVAFSGNVKLLRTIVQASGIPDLRDQDGRTPLQWAAAVGREDVVQCLLEVGADILAEDPNGVSSVFIASQCPSTFTAVSKVVEATRLAGGDPMKPNNHGATPLHAAALAKNTITAISLILEGADPLARDRDGDTPAALAIAMDQPNDELAVLLIASIVEAGGDLSLPGHNGETLLHRAMRFSGNFVVRYLSENGADVSARNDEGLTPLDIALLDQRDDQILDLLVRRIKDPQAQFEAQKRLFDVALNKKDWERAHGLLQIYQTPLPESHINSSLWQAAAQATAIDQMVFKLLLRLFKTGCSALDFLDEGGWSALHYVCSAKAEHSQSVVAIMERLIDEGASLDLKNHAGLTPLHRAIYARNRGAVELLVKTKCREQGRAEMPDVEAAIECLMTMEQNIHSLVVDRNGHTAIDRAVLEFQDAETRAIFGALLKWTDTA